MSVLILLEVEVKAETSSKLQSLLAEMFTVTREQEGCHDIDMYIDSKNSSQLMLVERWETLKQYKKYRLWRIKTGVMEKLSSMFNGTPNIRVLDKVC